MKQYFNKFITIFLCICLLLPVFLLSGCEEESYSVYFGAETMPKNLDPQKAQSFSELLAVRNLYRGLFKEDSDGSIIYDLAEGHTVSNDELTYTIKLKDSLWSDGTAVTAYDFQFGSERAKNPATASPSAKLLDNVYSVKATDTNTLEIKLNKPDNTFTTLLTSAVFMPCNQKFFEKCEGKYGLNKDSILTNGYYKVKQWSEENSLRLSLSAPDDFESTVPQNIFISVSASNKNSIERIKADEIGFTVNGSHSYSNINTDRYNVFTSYNKSYALIFNRNSDVGKNQLLTSAFARSINKQYYSSRMNERFKASRNILPEDCKFMFNSVDNKVNEYSLKFDAEASRNDFLTAIREYNNKKLPQISVLYSGNEDIKAILGDVVSQWQSNLGAYVNISALSESNLYEKVKSGSFTVALVPLSGNAYEILSLFSDKNSAIYLNNTEYDNSVNNLLSAEDFESAQPHINNCLKILSNESTVIPIVSAPTAYIYSNNYKEFNTYKTDGTVDFLNFNKIQ